MLYPGETFSGSNNEVEFVKDYRAYSESAMIGGQQPALKRIMRVIADTKYLSGLKIGLTVIG